MKVRLSGLAVAVTLAAGVWACGSPTKPSMSFAAPVAQGTNGQVYNFNQQPITLRITNSVVTGSKPVTYNVEVSTSDQFNSTVFTATDVPQGGDGSTSVQLNQLDGNTNYFWRWRAVVDGTAGEPSLTQSFFVRPNIVLQPPPPQGPTGGSAVFSARPTFTVGRADRTGPAGTIFYEFQVASNSSFNNILASATVQETGNATSWTPSTDLPEGGLFWRARAKDIGNNIEGPFSSSLGFERKFGIDLNSVNYMVFPNVSKWPETARITDASKNGDQVCTFFEGGNFPNAPFLGDPSTPIVANQWIFALINGTWYGGAGHWMRPGQYCKTEYDHEFFTTSFGWAAPFSSLELHSGDVFGVMVSTPARFYPDGKTTDQRSNVVMLVW